MKSLKVWLLTSCGHGRADADPVWEACCSRGLLGLVGGALARYEGTRACRHSATALLLEMAGRLEVRAFAAPPLRERLGRSLVQMPLLHRGHRWRSQFAAQVCGKGSGLSPMAGRVEEESRVCRGTFRVWGIYAALGELGLAG